LDYPEETIKSRLYFLSSEAWFLEGTIGGKISRLDRTFNGVTKKGVKGTID
jgi:hypothetical protein